MPEIETSGALLEVARSFRPRILAERDHIEASRRLPEDLARELARDGFFRIFLPKAGSISPQGKRWRFSRSWLGRTPRSRGAYGTATLIGLLPNSPLRLHEQSTPIPMSLRRTVRAPRVGHRSSLVDTA
jgi:alkylation response protein AidB-like acyl-CoA dehydrogenase